MTPEGEPGLTRLCAGPKTYFAHSARPMRPAAEMLSRGGEALEIMALLAGEARAIARNRASLTVLSLGRAQY